MHSHFVFFCDVLLFFKTIKDLKVAVLVTDGGILASSHSPTGQNRSG